MAIYKKAHTLVKQFFLNLLADDWVYRHAQDIEPDYPAPLPEAGPDVHVSSLSLALNQMGIHRHSPGQSAMNSTIT